MDGVSLYDLDEGLQLYGFFGPISAWSSIPKSSTNHWNYVSRANETLLNVLKDMGLDGMPSILNGQPIGRVWYTEIQSTPTLSATMDLFMLSIGVNSVQHPFDLLYYLFWHTRAAPHV